MGHSVRELQAPAVDVRCVANYAVFVDVKFMCSSSDAKRFACK